MYAATLHIEYEHFYFPEDFSDIVLAESDAEQVQTTPALVSIKQLISELEHKVPSFIHTLLYNSCTSINAFTAFLCSKKQSHCNLLPHIHTIHIYIQVHYMLTRCLSIVKYKISTLS